MVKETIENLPQGGQAVLETGGRHRQRGEWGGTGKSGFHASYGNLIKI